MGSILDRKTFNWWLFLCFFSIFNISIYAWAVLTHWNVQSYSFIQPILSALYVAICAFRSFLPRIDLERHCLFDIPLSSIFLGRSLATIAEIAFSIQCALLIFDLGMYLNNPFIQVSAYLIVPLIVLAQTACWYATLSLNHFWHSVEEALWVIMLSLTTISFTIGFYSMTGWMQVLMLIGIATSLAAAYIMLFIDIPMYIKRAKQNKKNFLPVAIGIKDAISRRKQTSEWDVWKHEVMWISTYFTVGVWLSIAMIFIQF